MTIDSIVAIVNARPNPTTGEAGYLTRLDVDNALIVYNDNDKKVQNITAFLSNFTFLTFQDKQTIIKDVDSYIDV